MYRKKEPSPRKKGKVKRPEALIESVSPFKILDRVFKPCYVLVVQHPNESRNVVITTISVYVPKFEKKRVDVSPPSQDVTVRRYFENIIEKPDYVMQPKIHVGTVEGKIKIQIYKEEIKIYMVSGIESKFKERKKEKETILFFIIFYFLIIIDTVAKNEMINSLLYPR